MIKYFDHKEPKGVRVQREITVRVFDHLDITTWRGIHQRWMFIDHVLEGSARNKFKNYMISCKEIDRNERGYQWGLGKPEDVCSV